MVEISVRRSRSASLHLLAIHDGDITQRHLHATSASTWGVTIFTKISSSSRSPYFLRSNSGRALFQQLPVVNHANDVAELFHFAHYVG